MKIYYIGKVDDNGRYNMMIYCSKYNMKIYYIGKVDDNERYNMMIYCSQVQYEDILHRESGR